MGIQGLLPLLKSIMVPIHVKELEGSSVAIDTYSWLHKAALSCSIQLCKGLPTSRHIDYCMHRVNLLRHYGVKPVLVFDGGLLPMKGEQENKRARARKENLARAVEHESNGNSAAAYECYQKAVDISPSIAHELIQVLKQENVCYVVAPYEADAQMTFLAVNKKVDAIITEDSDLIPFGCPRIIFKMDKFGQGVEFRYSMLQQNKDISFAGFTKQMLLEMCILSGCDYLQSLPGMGLKRAHALIQKFKNYNKVVKHLRYSTDSVPPLYEESFKKAIWTFQHQRVYDPVIEDIVYLSNPPDDIGNDVDFLGPLLPQHIAKGIAEGDVDPFTKMPFQGKNISTELMPDKSYRLKKFKPESERKKLDLPVQKNLLTSYFCFASLESKRKFKAPRITTKHSSPTDGFSLSPGEQFTEKTAAGERNCSPVSLLDSRNLGSVPLSEDSVEDGVTAKVTENLNFHDLEVKDSVVDSRYLEDALLQQSMRSTEDPSPATHEHVSDAIEDKIRTENRKVVVSSYFQHKMVNEDAGENKKEVLLVKSDLATNKCDNMNIEMEHAFGKYSYKGTAMKRKTNSANSVRTENVKVKYVQTNASHPEKSMFLTSGNHNPKLDDTFMVTEDKEKKFGCNISHLGQYSDIAEKSMERFVSVVSSFRCSSSGSRASGLRAPLKDVQNTHSNRATIDVDFSKFTFVPNNQKTSASSHRR